MNLRPKRHRAVIRRIAALIALALAVLFALPASAGALRTSDDAGVFTSSQLESVRKGTAGYPFDVRLVTSSSYATRSELGSYVHRFVTEPNLVVIGLDPVHRHVSVHFGTGTGIADSEFKAIESVGIPHFKDGDWTGGVLSILDRAGKAAGTAGPTRVAPAHTSRGSGSSFGGIFWFVVIGGGVVLLIWLVARRRAQPAYGPPAGGYGPPAGGYGPPVGGGYGGPGPSYGGGGGSGIGTGIAAAGIGGLIGYELGKEVGERHHRHHDYDDDRPPRGYGDEGPDDGPEPGGAEGEPGNYDAGGSTGGWDDSGGGGGGGGGDDSDF